MELIRKNVPGGPLVTRRSVRDCRAAPLVAPERPTCATDSWPCGVACLKSVEEKSVESEDGGEE